MFFQHFQSNKMNGTKVSHYEPENPWELTGDKVPSLKEQPHGTMCVDFIIKKREDEYKCCVLEYNFRGDILELKQKVYLSLWKYEILPSPNLINATEFYKSFFLMFSF